jgi:hypothetical protein
MPFGEKLVTLTRVGAIGSECRRFTKHGLRQTGPSKPPVQNTRFTGILCSGGSWGMNRAWNDGAEFYFVIDPNDQERRSPSRDYLKELYPFYGTPFPFIKGVGEYLPVQNNAVDLVVIQDALDHFLAPKTVVHEAYRILYDHGVLAIMADVTDSKRISFGF